MQAKRAAGVTMQRNIFPCFALVVFQESSEAFTKQSKRREKMNIVWDSFILVKQVEKKDKSTIGLITL